MDLNEDKKRELDVILREWGREKEKHSRTKKDFFNSMIRVVALNENFTKCLEALDFGSVSDWDVKRVMDTVMRMEEIAETLEEAAGEAARYAEALEELNLTMGKVKEMHDAANRD